MLVKKLFCKKVIAQAGEMASQLRMVVNYVRTVPVIVPFSLLINGNPSDYIM